MAGIRKTRSDAQRSFWRAYTLSDPDRPCPRCAYSLVGLEATSARCPECGRELTVADRLAEYRFLPVWDSVRTICALPAAGAMVMLLLLAVTFLVGEGLVVVAAVVAGGCWLVSGAVMTLSLIMELLRTRSLRRGVQQREHEFRIFIAAIGLAVVMVVPVLGLAALFAIAGVGR